MNASALLRSLEKQGVQINLEGSDLRLRSSEPISAFTLEQVRQSKPEIIETLRGRKSPRNDESLFSQIPLKGDEAREPEVLAAMERLLKSLGTYVQTPFGLGRLVYFTPHGVVVQVNGGLMYTIDPRKVGM